MSYLIGQKIKEIRKDQNISQDFMANELKMTRQKYSRIENGQSNIAYNTIKEISKILNVDIRDITDVETEKKDLKCLFRQYENEQIPDETIDKIQNILKYFVAHEKLYFQMEDKNV